MKTKNKKKKNNKDDMKVVSQGFEDGYEDPKDAQLKEAKRRIEEANKPFNPMDFLSTKNIIIFILWYSLYRLFLKYNFGAVYFMLTIIALIFMNLGQRKPGELSAYSVFNPNHERILGTMTTNEFGLGQNGFYYEFSNNENNDENNPIAHMRQVEREINEELNRKIHYDTKSELRKEYLKSKAEQSLNSNCSCGSGKKYKNCCLKKVK
jgi:hypothetical protein